MAILTVEDVSLAYDSTPVVQHLNFSLSRGDNLVIVGENGSGKSTLMRALMGLMPVLSGTIRFGDGLTRKQVGYLPQQSAHAMDFPASVREVVLSGTLSGMRGWFYTRQAKEKMREALAMMEIEDLEKQSYQALSGGQRQRVLLARALCAASELLMMDEPIAGLDPIAAAGLYRMMRLLHENGTTLISVSHDLPEALRDATHVLHLYAHGDSWFGTVDEYRKRGGI